MNFEFFTFPAVNNNDNNLERESSRNIELILTESNDLISNIDIVSM